MGFKSWLASLFKEEKPEERDPAISVFSTTSEIVKTDKEIATERGEPWVEVLGIEVDMDNLGSGAFDLDFNEIFVAKLVRAGYKGKTDYEVVDQWFIGICKEIVKETYEQHNADPTNRRNNS